MKKTIILAVIAVAILILGMSLDFNDTHYTLNTEVIAIENETISVKDENGEVWQFTIENNNLKINDKIILTMDTHNTNNNIYDDEIINYKRG